MVASILHGKKKWFENGDNGECQKLKWVVIEKKLILETFSKKRDIIWENVL